MSNLDLIFDYLTVNKTRGIELAINNGCGIKLGFKYF